MNANTLWAPICDSCDDAQSAYRLLAVAAVNAARAELVHIAMHTDTPDWRDVEAADNLDAAHALLVRVSP
jgi:hypothetical protein